MTIPTPYPGTAAVSWGRDTARRRSKYRVPGRLDRPSRDGACEVAPFSAEPAHRQEHRTTRDARRSSVRRPSELEGAEHAGPAPLNTRPANASRQRMPATRPPGRPGAATSGDRPEVTSGVRATKRRRGEALHRGPAERPAAGVTPSPPNPLSAGRSPSAGTPAPPSTLGQAVWGREAPGRGAGPSDGPASGCDPRRPHLQLCPSPLSLDGHPRRLRARTSLSGGPALHCLSACPAASHDGSPRLTGRGTAPTPTGGPPPEFPSGGTTMPT